MLLNFVHYFGLFIFFYSRARLELIKDLNPGIYDKLIRIKLPGYQPYDIWKIICVHYYITNSPIRCLHGLTHSGSVRIHF